MASRRCGSKKKKEVCELFELLSVIIWHSNMLQTVAGLMVTHLQVQSDGEEDQCCRHSCVSSEQQDLLACILNGHKLQHQSTF